MIDEQTLIKYESLLTQDPQSKVFAIVADTYREKKQLTKAHDLCAKGLKAHPEYVGGLITMGRILLDENKPLEALKHINQATQLAPQNLLAYQLLGETYLSLKNTKSALKSFKMALFIDPQHEKAQMAIKKLESITADEYEDDLFKMSKIQNFQSENRPKEPPLSLTKGLERELSYLDALLVRGHIDQAKSRLNELLSYYPKNPELESRLKLISPNYDQPQTIRPQIKREKLALNQKIESLQRLLKVIENKKFIQGTSHQSLYKNDSTS